jgi:hypothetical protein
MAKPRGKKVDYVPETNCFLCKKPSDFRDHPDPRREFICSRCTMVLVKNPRIEGQRWEDLIPETKKILDPDLQKELSDILNI